MKEKSALGELARFMVSDPQTPSVNGSLELFGMYLAAKKAPPEIVKVLPAAWNGYFKKTQERTARMRKKLEEESEKGLVLFLNEATRQSLQHRRARKKVDA